MKVEIELNERESWPHYAVTLRECFESLISSVQYHEQPYEGEVRKLYNSGGRCVGELVVEDSGTGTGTGAGTGAGTVEQGA